MAPTVNFITGEIFVPKVDTTLVSLGPPEIRAFDVDQFWLDLKDAEYSEAGMPWPNIQFHDPAAVLSGDNYVQRIRIIPPYFVTFEDGQYVVNLNGGNHNILDVATANQVSLRAFNSAGKVNLGGVFPTKQEIAAEVDVVLSAAHGADTWDTQDLLSNNATIVNEPGGTRLVTIFQDDGTTIRTQVRVSADGLTRTRIV